MANGKPKVEPHPLVAALNPEPSEPPARTVKLYGLPGKSPSEGHTRLWTDTTLNSYVDVPEKSIRYAKTLPDDAGSVLWVDADAPLTHGSTGAYSSTGSYTAQSGFLTGSIAATHLGGASTAAAGGAYGGPQPTPPVHITYGCSYGPHCGPVTLPFCRSEAMLPSHCTPCGGYGQGLPSSPEVCWPSHAIPCHTRPPQCPLLSSPEVCSPSHGIPCPTMQCQAQTSPVMCTPSHMIPCNTHPPVCHPMSYGICPVTHLGPCESIHVICPTPSAVHRCGTEPMPYATPSVHTICATPTAMHHC